MDVSVIRCGAACLVAAALCACSQKSAEEKGADMAAEKIDMVTGIGNALTDKGGKAAESIASGVGTVVKGVERGALKVGRKLDIDPSLAKAGLAVSRVQDGTEAGNGAAHGLLAYVIASTRAEGSLRMFAYDALGREIGRSSVPVAYGGDDAGYVALSWTRTLRWATWSRSVSSMFPASSWTQSKAGPGQKKALSPLAMDEVGTAELICGPTRIAIDTGRS